MIWGDFLFRRLKFEIKAIGENIPLVGLSAFLCCICGILLWVSGGSTWFALRVGVGKEFTLSLTGAFLLWLLCYGLVGIMLALIVVACRSRVVGEKRAVKAFALCMLSYLLMLSWYAVFFCTRLTVFPLILLVCSVAVIGVTAVVMRGTLCLLILADVLIDAIQIYFIFFSIVILR